MQAFIIAGYKNTTKKYCKSKFQQQFLQRWAQMINRFQWFMWDAITHPRPNCSSPDSKVHGAHLGPTGPWWAPGWPHAPCYLGAVQLNHC